MDLDMLQINYAAAMAAPIVNTTDSNTLKHDVVHNNCNTSSNSSLISKFSNLVDEAQKLNFICNFDEL